MWNFSVHTYRGLEHLLHKELTASLPKQNIFPILAPGVVSGNAQSKLPLWRAKSSLFARNFRFRLHGPVLCSTLSDFRLRLRSEISWSEISFENFRVHTKSSKLFHDGALLKILTEEVGKFPKNSQPKFRGNFLHVDLINDNLEISLNTWSDDRKFLPLHAALVKAGVVEISDLPTNTCPKFPIIEWLSSDPPGGYQDWGFSGGEASEFFFRVRSGKGLAFGLMEDRKFEGEILEKAKKTTAECVMVGVKAKSNFAERSGLVWRPELRWTDQKGSWELLRLHR